MRGEQNSVERKKFNSLPEEGVSPFRRQDMTPEASGAKNQSERSEASTDKLIVKNEPPLGGPSA